MGEALAKLFLKAIVLYRCFATAFLGSRVDRDVRFEAIIVAVQRGFVFFMDNLRVPRDLSPPSKTV